MQVKTREMLQLKTCVISLVLCVKVRFDRKSDAPTAVSKGSVSPNLMKTTVSETLKAQTDTGPQREATKQTPKCHLEHRRQFGIIISRVLSAGTPKTIRRRAKIEHLSILVQCQRSKTL